MNADIAYDWSSLMDTDHYHMVENELCSLLSMHLTSAHNFDFHSAITSTGSWGLICQANAIYFLESCT